MTLVRVPVNSELGFEAETVNRLVSDAVNQRAEGTEARFRLGGHPGDRGRELS